MLTAILKSKIILLLLLSVNLYSNDTLMVNHLYPSPIPHPIAIEFFENSFWVANGYHSKVYRLNSNMILIDSIEVGHNRISGITYKDQKVWISVDQPVTDVAIPTNFVSYRIYGIDLASSSLTDSVLFKVGGKSNDTGIVYGISTINDTFYITLNKGYSSGIYSIIPDNTPLLKSYLPLSGMTLIGNELWGVRRSGNGRNGRWITSISRDDSLSLPIEAKGSDLAYDGTNVFICIPEESKIAKMESAGVPVKNTRRAKIAFRNIDTYKLMNIGNNFNGQLGAQYISLNGRSLSGLIRNSSNSGSQVFIGIGTKGKTKRRARK